MEKSLEVTATLEQELLLKNKQLYEGGEFHPLFLCKLENPNCLFLKKMPILYTMLFVILAT